MDSSCASAITEDPAMTEAVRVGERDPDYVQREKNIRAALNIFKKMDRDEGYISYILLQKLFGHDRKCPFCGVKGPGKVPNTEECLELYVGECGVIARQDIECLTCGKVDILVTCDNLEELPSDVRFRIKGSEACRYYKTISHFEILHDLMKMLRVAALDDRQKRREGYADLADFILHNARRVCEEWCKPEYAELRLKKYLRLREETLLTTYQPYFTPDVSEEYKEMYGMMADSFRENRGKVLQLLSLMKESLIDRPTQSSFMMWVSVSMIHAEAYQVFSTMYDPCHFMRGDYPSLQERYMALNVPIGIKKIPVVFMLFEVPRFYYYIDFLYRKVGRGTGNYLTAKDRAALALLGENVTINDETLNVPPTSVSYEPTPDPDHDYVPMISELGSQLDLVGEWKPSETGETTKLAVMTSTIAPQQSAAHQPVVMTTDQFRSMLVDHLKANEASVASETHQPTYHRYIGGKLVPPLPLSTRNALLSSARTGPKPGRSSRARKEARKARQLGVTEPDRKTVLVCQVDTDALRARGFHVGEGSRKTTIIASKDGNLEHILEGVETPEQVKSFLSQKYNILSQQQGTGYITVPNSDESLDLSHASPAPGAQRYDANKQRNQKGTRNAKKKKRYMKPIAAPPTSTAATATAPKQEPDDGLSGFPFTSSWTKERRANFKQEILKGLGEVPTRSAPSVQSTATGSSSSEKPKSKEEEDESLSLSNALAKVLAPIDPLESIRKEIRDKCDEHNIPMPDLEVTHAPLQFTKSPPGCKEPVTVTLTTRVKLKPNEDYSRMRDPPYITEIKDDRKVLYSKTTETRMGKPEVVGEARASLEKKLRKLKGRKMREREREEYESKYSPEIEKEDLESPAVSAASSPVVQTPTDPVPASPAVQTPTDPVPASSVVQTPTDPIPDSPVVQTPTDSIPDSPVVQTPTDPIPDSPVVQTPTDPIPDSLLSRDPCDVVQPDEVKSKKTARDRFKSCENCRMEVSDRILLCAGCKKVAYCNYRCQKAHWKIHKKACSYALKKGHKDRTG